MTAVTRPANRSAVTGCQVPPAFAANIARSGSLAAQSKTSSHALPAMNHHLHQGALKAPACPALPGPGRAGEFRGGSLRGCTGPGRDQSAFSIVILLPSGLPSGTGTLTSRIPLW